MVNLNNIISLTQPLNYQSFFQPKLQDFNKTFVIDLRIN